MATLESDDSNILDAEAVNWRLVVCPVLAVLIIVVGGFGYYYYLQNQREELEATARAALLQAKTPDELVKVADRYPHSDQAALALMKAADLAFGKADYKSAADDYQKIVSLPSVDETLAQSARLGLASSLEAAGKIDDAINAYLKEAALKKDAGAGSPYAPYAYISAARLYEEKGDKEDERKILTEAARLDSSSSFVKQAQFKLKEMTSAAQPPLNIAVPATPSQK